MKKIKTGDTVKIKKEHNYHVKVLKDSEANAQTLATFAAASMRESGKKLWEFVHEMYPETVGYHMTLKTDQSGDSILLITGRI